MVVFRTESAPQLRQVAAGASPRPTISLMLRQFAKQSFTICRIQSLGDAVWVFINILPLCDIFPLDFSSRLRYDMLALRVTEC